jgi:class 3 adenylate cyclase/tetratricopeptide (TPR) repeat protein
MTCLRCQAENRLGRRFCSECGAPLALACPACSFSNEPGEKFCGGCGTALLGVPPLPDPRFGSPQAYTPKHLVEKILTTKSALEGERKQVTVLFVDVSGFTALSERLDPEDVHRVMTRAFELMLVEVHRYEGTINQFLGDGIMALFGAPIAHEDHAVRAVHASLGLKKALAEYQGDLLRTGGLTLHVRQGLNTGLVVVGSIGSDLRMDYTAVGDTTNVAARLQQAAHPGQVVISEATHRLIEGYFDTHPLGALQLKGKADAVPGWEVLGARGARTRFEVRAERGLTPFVGRQRELGMLLERFEQANDGHGQVVFIVGEPGIGKSRLLYELHGRLGEAVTWLEGRCLSFGRSIAFHPLIDLLRRSFGIEESDLDATMIEKIERAVLALGDELRPTLPFLRYLLSVDPGDPAVLSMDPQQRRGDLFDALRRLTAQGAQARPQVVVYEDLHWIDQATQEYLAFTDDNIPANRVLRILTYRPGYAHSFGERTYHTRLALTALSTEASVQMAARMLSTRALPEELAAVIAQKAEGNPFFVEEVVRSLQETGAIRPAGDRYVLTRPLTEIFVPDTIQDVIMARIDRLAEASKRTLQLASVIGRDFSHRLVERLSDSGGRTRELLGDLTSTELIHEKAVFPELGYTFKHALTHEVTYSSLLIQQRKALHQQIGLAIEELYTDRLAEQFAVLAYHFTRAEAWAKAHEYLLKAADKAAKAFATREAIALYEQAETAASRLGDAVPARPRMAVHQAKADLYLLISAFDRARDEGERVLALARGVDDHVAEGSALVAMGLASWLGHKFSRALDDARQAIAVAEAAGAPSVLAGGHLVTALVYEMTGRLDEASRTFDQVIRISRQSGDGTNESWASVFAAELKGWEASFDEASRLYAEGIRIARAHNVLLPVLEGLFMWGINLTGQGAYDGALALLEEGLALAERVGDENYTPRYLNSLGWLYMECGDLPRALALNRRSVEGARQRRDDESIANAELNLADIHLMTGDLPLAQQLLDGVQSQVKNPATSEWMRWRYSIHLFASLADLRLARGDFAKAREAADQCLELATRTNSRKYLAKAWRVRGEIALARRQWDEAQAAFRQALGIGQRIGAPTHLWKTHFALGRLHAETKVPESASASYEAARGVVDQLMARLRNPGLRASLEDSPSVRQIRELAERTRET